MTGDASGSRMTYAGAGVNIDAAAEAKRRIRGLARSTFTRGVLSDIGSFGALFRLEPGKYADPLLTSSCDGVGTKLKIAFMTGIHDTVGYDLVSHCVSDILVQGARPLFFLDYLASGQLEPDVVAGIVSGLARGCSETGCALIGGETAEMPDFYAPGEYDLAGFIVGVVDRARVIDGTRIRPGDVLLGLASAGLHTNGYSLARKLFFDRLGLRPADRVEELGGTVAEILLSPHRSYYALIEPLLDTGMLKGLAHITGGGITDNLPRILPPGTAAVISKSSWPVLPVFRFIQREGNVDDAEMYRTFNMGIGMIAVIDPRDEEAVAGRFGALGERCYRIGAVVEGPRTIEYLP
ncbi:MAG: phosphoribosylformylglycinamidine cyclo-ligase [Acidobacteria bacterium]|nr:phosphoribosylformylglycinamidine cyclo-ligase [Acidobacteriota bacterium]